LFRLLAWRLGFFAAAGDNLEFSGNGREKLTP